MQFPHNSRPNGDIMPAFTQVSCTCPIHCPPEGLEERQKAAAQRPFWIMRNSARVETFVDLGEALDYVHIHRDCDIVRLTLNAPDRGPALGSEEEIQSRLAEQHKRVNPLARTIWDEHAAEVEAFEHLLPVGVELSASPGCRVGGPLPDDECRFAWLEFAHLTVDLTGDIPGQLAERQQAFALELLESAVWLRNLPDDETPPTLEVPAAVEELIDELPIGLQARGTGMPGEFALTVSQTIHIADSEGDVGGDLASALDFLAEETGTAAMAIRQRLAPSPIPLRGPHTRPSEAPAAAIELEAE